MTVALSTNEVGRVITGRFPGAVAEVNERAIVLNAESLLLVAEYLKNDPDYAFDYLNFVTAVDYYDYFEVVYQVTSLRHNHTLVLKTRCYNRDTPVVPSVMGLWRGADLQERETYDLMGIVFEGHSNLKRIALWEGFQGHPLRKDYSWNGAEGH